MICIYIATLLFTEQNPSWRSSTVNVHVQRVDQSWEAEVGALYPHQSGTSEYNPVKQNLQRMEVKQASLSGPLASQYW